MSSPSGASPSRSWWGRHRLLTALLVAVLLFVLLAGVALFSPLFDRRLSTEAEAAASYAEAMAHAERLKDRDTREVNPVCRSRVVDQGQQTEQAVVLLHGYTNCPAQFDLIAQAYADAGYSVVVPRLPGHGDGDRLSTSLSQVSPAGLVEVAYQSVDIAAGLGEEVTVVGLSGGGTLTGYLAGHRDDVDRAVLMAPLVVPKALPEMAVGPASRAFRYVPDIYWWWDGEKRAALDDPPYAYPRFSFRSLGAFLAVGRAAQADQPRDTALRELVVVSNESDDAVSNTGVESLAQALEPIAERRTNHVFAAELGYGHDLVDPLGEDADKLPEIYPVLGPLLGVPELSVK